MKLQDLLRHLYYEPSLITPEAHASIRDALERHFASVPSVPSVPSPSLQREATDICGNSVDIPQAELIDGIMHIPVGGVIGNKLDPFERASGAVDVTDLMNEIDEAESNRQARGVLF